jgi:hypothetical protein
MKKDNLTDIIQQPIPKTPINNTPKPVNQTQQVVNPQGQTVTLGLKKK